MIRIRIPSGLLGHRRRSSLVSHRAPALRRSPDSIHEKETNVNTTLSASQTTRSKHPHPPNAGVPHLSIELPHGEALRRLSARDRLQLRLAIWLLLRTSAPAAALEPEIARAERHARLTAQRAALADYELQRQLQLAARSRMM